MKSAALTAVLVAILAVTSHGQGKSLYQRTHSEGFYLNLGMARGPDFSDFFNYTNEYYQSRFANTGQELDRFDKGFNVGLGYLVRLYPNFALDVGFSIYRLKSAGRIENNNVGPSAPELYVDHDLDYQVGIFSASIPVLLDFAARQPLVPYAGIGISIFSMRLDDIRYDGSIYASKRETNAAVGGHFEAGMFFKLNRKIWIDFKARWYSGSAHLRTAEPRDSDIFGNFKIEQDLSQFTLGAVYYFR